ncbi:hypothetical protein F5Y00DRAFT_266280 [Daldinia vernicosa]|uniref:uncharacterized protein n=1 Tax=Daldinia vernicosa TaxID=114800 RepID=UPI002008C04D|nr:uncharacterized protein F5Y00DRAFT_266280 [Daldinia vernicosa]KAI0844757.1 hypothetical protein F5Y00DRAFT_266280 [Daldinia vernicosa]
MNVKVITNKRGSILGKIPIKMSETPHHENTRDAEPRANRYRSSMWPGNQTGPRIPDGRTTRARTRAAQIEDNEHRERTQPSRQRANLNEGLRESRENDTGIPRHNEGAPPSSRGDYWFHGSSIRSLVKSFLGIHLPEEIASRGRISFAEGESFFPDPMVTFLVDRPKNLVCQICQTVKLSIGHLAQAPCENTPAILPCGHMACHNCLRAWVDLHQSCPFCRHEMKYEKCGHTLRPALIAHDTITTLPKTLSRGGKIAETCRECQERESKEKVLILWNMATEAVRSSREFPPDTDPEYASQVAEVTRGFFECVPQYAANIARERDTW